MKIPEASFDYAKETRRISNARTAVYTGDIICIRNGSEGMYLNCYKPPYFSTISLDFCLMSSLANYLYLYVVFCVE